MKRLLLIPVALVLTIAALYLLLGKNKDKKLAHILVTSDQMAGDSALHTGKNYHVALDPSSADQPDSWRVQSPDGSINHFTGTSLPAFHALVPGRYVIFAMNGQRELVRDTLAFTAGKQISVEWPSPESSVGSVVTAADHSVGVIGRKWRVFLGDRELPLPNVVDTGMVFSWVPASAGEYRLQLALSMPAAGDTMISSGIRVSGVTAPPDGIVQPVEKNPASPIVHKPDLKKEPKTPVKETPEKIEPQKGGHEKGKDIAKGLPPATDPTPAPVPSFPSDGCFDQSLQYTMRSGTPAQIPIPIPQWADVNWTTEAQTILDVQADRACQLASFRYWGNVNTGEVMVTITCVDDQCKGHKDRVLRFTTGDDQYNALKAEFPTASSPVLRPGMQYRITIKAAPHVDMGQVRLAADRYGNEGVKVQFPSGLSSVFDLMFRVR